MDSHRAVSTANAPPPAGTYSQAVVANGFIFVSGQTPRLPDGTRVGDRPFDEQVEIALTNLEAVAHAAGSSIASAVKVTVYLRDPSCAKRFDAIYQDRVGRVPPARTLVQSDLPGFDVEIDAILVEARASTKSGQRRRAVAPGLVSVGPSSS